MRLFSLMLHVVLIISNWHSRCPLTFNLIESRTLVLIWIVQFNKKMHTIEQEVNEINVPHRLILDKYEKS